MRHKTFELIETKASDSGTFEALVSVFGNVDYGGDRIREGAYTKSLDTWRESGDPIPIVFSHQWDDPMSHIGVASPDDVVETERGLVVKGRLDIEDNPVAKQVHKLLQRRSLKEFSIGYQVPDGGESRGKDGVNDISEMELIEAGPTLKGMNSETELAAVKTAAGVKELPEDVQPPPAEVEGVTEEGVKMLTPEASDPEADQFQLERIRALSSQRRI